MLRGWISKDDSSALEPKESLNAPDATKGAISNCPKPFSIDRIGPVRTYALWSSVAAPISPVVLASHHQPSGLFLLYIRPFRPINGLALLILQVPSMLLLHPEGAWYLVFGAKSEVWDVAWVGRKIVRQSNKSKKRILFDFFVKK